MLVALTSKAHGSDDIGHASALRDQGGMPVDEAFQILRPSSHDTSAGRRRSPRQLAAGSSGAVSSSPAVIKPVLILVPRRCVIPMLLWPWMTTRVSLMSMTPKSLKPAGPKVFGYMFGGVAPTR
jgi:hypothetical protein